MSCAAVIGMRQTIAALLLGWAVMPAGVLAAAPFAGQQVLTIGSKNFGESYLLSEIAAQLLEARGFEIQRRFGLGGTLICYGALVEGEIDLYMEYTGTLAQAVLKAPQQLSLAELNDRLGGPGQREALEVLAPFGFNNTYAMTMRSAQAQRLGIERITDLRAHPDLNIVVSHEFLERGDGWPGMSARYDLEGSPSGIEHGLAYQALADGAIDVTDAYSTDGELARYSLKVLLDDRGFFPEYLAAPLVRRDLPAAAREALGELAGRFTDTRMQELNAAVLAGAAEGEADFAAIAGDYLDELGLVDGAANPSTASARLWRELRQNTWRHLQLTLLALFFAILVGVGVGALVFRSPMVSKAVIYICGLLQTIPSIALLALMIPLFGIGFVPAIVALFLYALLPILRNTIVALTTIDPELIRTATAIGLSPRERLRHLLLPMALPNIFAGIRTSAVICVGTATLAAFIGAGGLGDPIVTGLSLNDTNLILRGALPAAVLAMLFELGFEGLERWLVPAPLRVERR